MGGFEADVVTLLNSVGTLRASVDLQERVTFHTHARCTGLLYDVSKMSSCSLLMKKKPVLFRYLVVTRWTIS